MVIHINDQLSNLIGNNEYNKRRDIWLWARLNELGGNLGHIEQAGNNIREKISHLLTLNPQLTEPLKNEMTNRLLPDSDFKWINEGRRQINWITSKISEKSNIPLFNLPISLHNMDRLFFIIDIWATDVTYKKITLNDIQEKWRLQKKYDKPFEWFRDDRKKTKLAWEWLQKNTYLAGVQTQFSEDYDDLLIFFDNTSITPEQKELYLGKIKRSWSQKKYRENLEGKEQCNLTLSTKSIETLKNLAARHDISRNRVIEILLEMEEIKNEYLTERSQLRKTLNSDRTPEP
ncbi:MULTISPECIES: hypothetical protein [Pseudomonas]|uniref:hypothetical protein n=1 Tax=Pseudomonas TaxID=286 RepID=UPI000EB138ED|nr:MULTISPECIES: hypothetical protein [Pseudomonas]MBI8111870.1 hypothetical protein [Pseudomonas aeruginosa]MBI8241788.1 hypothetical protein [Pseudomonas aeruginosa]MBI8378430.1 hypothetical protein [Pseudomonas aeruginosa]MCV0236634.1 hypothetical protein [Pseudomonas aeruginosa]MDV6731356.1 hypothetical protein [Pseudomonas aeruginosa]